MQRVKEGVGERSTRWLTDENGSTLPQMVHHLVERHMQISYAVLRPNPPRLSCVRDVPAERQHKKIQINTAN